MKPIKHAFLFILISMGSQAQETLLRNNFSVRDFFIKKDSIFLIEKRDVSYFNYLEKNRTVQTYFIGGYGLEIYDDSKNNQIITVSNEFSRPVSSLRFYNKSFKEVKDVYYYTEGRSLDAIIIPDLNYAILSLSDKKIIVVNYEKKPDYEISHNITLSSIARSMAFKDGYLYYATDLGEIFKYNFATKENTILLAYEKMITDFTIFDKYIVFTTKEGEIVKFSFENGFISKLDLSTDFILNSIQYQKDQLICGTFKGKILVINVETMSILDQLNYHKRSILKIVNYKNNEFYSSSIDKTIKKWKLIQ
ncbi:hypothetical protein [Gelidibacter japonicus]|uniref:hypothetical protein n=1 Tax=Gelidibacter japonicus TaxID=1962232 RepID=UPI0013D09EB7|nr:hypothetical protein [Gelidibacter japonicus]MCL8008104.1 hypothetical protein [Gelidibacter japonicus]